MNTDDAASVDGAASFMSSEQQGERRKQIKEIMKDPSLSQSEKSRTIQSLMDGRRRSSCGGTTHSSTNDEDVTEHSYVSAMAGVAAAAADFYSSDEEGDAIMDGTDRALDELSYGYDHYHENVAEDHERSVASELTYTSGYSYDAVASPQVSQRAPQLPVPPQGLPYKQYHGRSLSLQDWNDQDRAIAASDPHLFHNQSAQAVSRLMEQSRPPCQHYDRCCTIVSPCCGLAFGCRICHDECPVLPPPLSQRKNNNSLIPSKQATERRRSMPADLNSNDEENHHLIDRFAIREIICRECFCRQPAKTDNCIECGIQFAEYHCNICNLWMSGQDNPYHCEDCGFCRVGGRENFKHCHDCGMCIDAVLFNDHNCKSGKYMSNCPICQEDLFSSRQASHEMPCGHAIHWHCFKELTSYDTRCPVCKKTAETPEQMAATWSAISMGISLQPVPAEMARLVNIYCNDCEGRQENRRWHFLGVRCNACLSFNTTVEQIVLSGQEAADFLDRREAEGTIPANIVAMNEPDEMMIDAPGAGAATSESSFGSS